MLWVLVIAWLVVVAAASVWAGMRGYRLMRVARAAQAEVEQHLIHSRLELLPERLAELERRQHELQEVLARLQRAVAEFMVLWSALAAVRGQVSTARSFFTSK
jgi:hypothetical protein